MYRFAVCDDDNAFLKKIEKCIQNSARKQEVSVTVKTYNNGTFLLDDINNGLQYDIYILDIEMPGITGMEMARRIRQTLSEAIVMFVTAHLHYALESFELEIFRYIPKELSDERLPMALEAAFLRLDCQEGKYYFVTNAKRSQKIFYKDIIYIYKEEKNVGFVLDGGSEIKVRETLQAVYDKLNDDFVQADRCYIVNLCHIHRVDSVNNRITLKNNIMLNIPKKRIQELKERVNRFWGERI